MKRFTPTPRTSSQQSNPYFAHARTRYFTFDSPKVKRGELPPLSPYPVKQISHTVSERKLAFKDVIPLTLPPKLKTVSNVITSSPSIEFVMKDVARCSLKPNGVVKAYAANTTEGLVRNYNEDRVSIVYNIVKPSNRADNDWPTCSYFGVFDGHGGSSCADFLRDSLHHFIIKQACFPAKPKKALIKGFEAAEEEWTAIATKDRNSIDRSGSCAVVILIVNDVCYIANVGDSRALLSADSGAKVYSLTKDHKPNEESEQRRILEAGGEIYQSHVSTGAGSVPGVYRISPGRLSVSRSFGDVEAKQERYGGNHKVLIAVPEIRTFRVTDSYDFVLLGSDGIFDKLSNKDAVAAVWSIQRNQAANVHRQCGLGVDAVIRSALARHTLDNVTVVVIGFKHYELSYGSSVP